MKKIVGIIIMTIFSAFLGLFVLPLEVETTRWITVERSTKHVWKEISDQNYSWSWGASKDAWIEDNTYFYISEVKNEDFELHFRVKNDAQEEIGSGKVYLENIPEGLWLRCKYVYVADYAPIGRLQDWLRRGELAIQIDKALLRMKTNLEQKPQGKDE